MKRECIELLVGANREIEFVYLKRRFSITYYNDNREKYISVCEFYRTPTDVKNVEELLKLTISGKSLEEIFATLPDSAIDIF